MTVIRQAIRNVMLPVLLSVPASAAAQTVVPERAKVVVTVTDQTGAILPGASVTITHEEQAATPVLAPVQTSPAGVATVENLAPGRYTIPAAFSGFETVIVLGIRVRAGETRRPSCCRSRKCQRTSSSAATNSRPGSTRAETRSRRSSRANRSRPCRTIPTKWKRRSRPCRRQAR